MSISDVDHVVPYPAEAVARYRADGLWQGRSLSDSLVDACLAHGPRIALVTPEVRWTYSDLAAQVDSFAAGIETATDLMPGDRIMFQMGNTAETVVAYLGSLRAGLVPVCTLAQHGAREVGLLAGHVGARALLTQGDFGGGRLLEVARGLVADGSIETAIVARTEPFDGAVGYDQIQSAGRGVVPSTVTPTLTDVAVFQLSGGTTGLPKVAPRLHEEYVYNSRAWAQALGWTSDTVVLYPLPLMHNAGIALALQPVLLSGASIVLAPGADIDGMLDLIAAERPTSLPLVPPAVAIRLLDHPRTSSADLTSITQFVVGGQKLPGEVAHRLRDELNMPLRQMFGMAEGMFYLTPPDASDDIVLDTVGAPISPLDEARVVDPLTGKDVPAGELGELWMRGPYTIRGYYRAPEHNAAAFSDDGFYRSGDLGRRHHIDGVDYFSVDGRIKDVINRGVEKIHAEEVEELILRNLDVESAAVVSMPDPVLGERACAFLVMRKGAEPFTVASLGEHLASHGLAKYKFPERVEIRDSLPLSNVGKLSRKDLRDEVSRLLEAESVSHSHADA
ncbi:(2,3-dihydroxybenzoyl)adenylate synthase [Gordonia sihwensis]|uniref:(2,3-dihydroxybenzoyl)adenylate synthase n=1 Tax=Gordonia sihwensis TaxID=173559 RepID=UPI003D9715A1